MYSLIKTKSLIGIRSVFGENVISALILINILLAITALIKDVFLASYLGTTEYADALTLALFVPDTLGNLLIAISINVACVPVFSMLYINEKQDRLIKCVKNINIIIAIATMALAVLLFVFRKSVMGSLGRGVSSHTIKMYIQVFLVILPIIILYPFIYTRISLLQVIDKFITPAFAPVLYNGIFLIAILVGYFIKIPINQGVFLLALSVTLGVISMAIIVIKPLSELQSKPFSLSKSPLSILKISREEVDDLKAIFRIFTPYLFIIMSSQMVLYVERLIASNFGKGSASGLSYAYRLSQFPIWVFVAAISTVILPALTKLNGKGCDEELKLKFIKSIRNVLLFSILMTIILFVLRTPVISILFERGSFDHKSLGITSSILKGYSLAIVGQSLSAICIRYFLAIGKMKIPLISCLTAASINIIADLYLSSKIGLAGLGYGAAIASLIGPAVMLLVIIPKMDLNIKGFLLQGYIERLKKSLKELQNSNIL